MHKKNIWFVLALVVVLVAVVGLATACGEAEETTTTAAPSGPTTTAAGPTTTAAPAETTTTVAAGPAPGGIVNFFIIEPAFIEPLNGQESEGVQVVQACSTAWWPSTPSPSRSCLRRPRSGKPTPTPPCGRSI